MARTVIAVFDGEVFRPAEPLDLAPDTQNRLTIEEEAPTPADGEPPLMKYVRLAQDLDLPSDFAEQHDHYLYGTPKQ